MAGVSSAIAALSAGAQGPVAPAPVILPAHRQANTVAVLTIRGGIDGVTLRSLERRMRKAKADGADAVVLDIDTPGGEMHATLDICNLVRDRRDTPANVVAWINPTAYSAGTIIALACREIVVAPNATFGDAAPIQITPIGMKSASPTERAKMLAPIVTEITDSARRNHYDENLVLAFVRLGDGVWMLEHATTRERVFVDKAEYRSIFGDDPPPSLAGQPLTGAAATQPARGLVRPAFDSSIPRSGDESGLSESELQQHRAYAQSLPPARAPLTAADRDQWRLVRQVVDDQSLLTLRTNEAMHYGLASAVIATDIDLQKHFGASRVLRYDESWSESMVRVLVSLPVRAILIIVFLVSLFIEIAAPGTGVFGAVAVTALLVLIGAPALANMASWWEILLIIAGLAMVLLEIFVLPGTGLIGLGGVLCLLVGLVSTFVSGDLSSPEGQGELWRGLTTTLVSIFIAGVGMWLISRQLHSFPIINRLILSEQLPPGRSSEASSRGDAGSGLLSAMGLSTEPATLRAGDVGVAETDLRPAGRANFHSRLFDVQSTGAFVQRGERVRVVNVGRFVTEVEEVSRA